MEGGSKRRRLNDDRVAEETTRTAETSQETGNSIALAEIMSRKRVLREMTDSDLLTWVSDLSADQVRYLASSFIALKYEPQPTNQGLVAYGNTFLSDIRSEAIKEKLQFTVNSETYPHSLSDPNSLGVSLLRSIKSGLDVSEKEESIGSVNRDQMRIESIMDGIEQLRLDASGRSLLSLPHSLICECLSFLTFRELCKSVSRVSHLMFGLSKEGAAHYFVCIDESMIKKGLNTGLFDLAAMRGFNHVHFKYLNCWDPKLDDDDSRNPEALRKCNSLTARVKTHNFKQLMQHLFVNSPRLTVLEFGTDCSKEKWKSLRTDVVPPWQFSFHRFKADNPGFIGRLVQLINENQLKTRIQSLVFNGHMFDYCFPYVMLEGVSKIECMKKDPRMDSLFGTSVTSNMIFPYLNSVMTRNIRCNLQMFLWLQNQKIMVDSNVSRWMYPSIQALVRSPVIFESLLFKDQSKLSGLDDMTSELTQSEQLWFGLNQEFVRLSETAKPTRQKRTRLSRAWPLNSSNRNELHQLSPKVALTNLHSLEVWFPSEFEINLLAGCSESRLLSMGDYQLCEDTKSIQQQLCLICDFPWFSDSTEESMSHSAPSFRRLFKECAPNLREMNWHITCESPAPNVFSEKKHSQHIVREWRYQMTVSEVPEHPLDHEGGSQPVMIEALNQAKDIVFTELRSLTITINAGLLIAMTSKLISPDELINWHCSFYDDLFSSSLICRFPKLTHFRLNLAVGEHWQRNNKYIHPVCSALICRISNWIREIRNGQKKSKCSCIVLSNVELVLCSFHLRMKKGSKNGRDDIFDVDLDRSNTKVFDTCVQSLHPDSLDRFKRLAWTSRSKIEVSSESISQLIDACGYGDGMRSCLSVVCLLQMRMYHGKKKAWISDPIHLVRKLCEIKGMEHLKGESKRGTATVSIHGLNFFSPNKCPMNDYLHFIFEDDIIYGVRFMGRTGVRFLL